MASGKRVCSETVMEGGGDIWPHEERRRKTRSDSIKRREGGSRQGYSYCSRAGGGGGGTWARNVVPLWPVLFIFAPFVLSAFFFFHITSGSLAVDY